MCFSPPNQTTHTTVLTVKDRTNEMLKAAAQLKAKEPAAPAEASPKLPSIRCLAG